MGSLTNKSLHILAEPLTQPPFKKISRRSLVIAAPMAMVLSACGSAESDSSEQAKEITGTADNLAASTDKQASSTLEANATYEALEAQEAEMKSTPSSIDTLMKDFLDFYHKDFRSYTATVAREILNRIILGSVDWTASRKPEETQKILDGLSPGGKKDFADDVRSHLNEQFPTDLPNLVRKYKYLEFLLYSQKFVDMANTDKKALNRIMQSRPHDWHDILDFLNPVLTPDAFNSFMNAANAIEKADDSRHLKGKVEDTTRIIPGKIWGETNQYEVLLGNLRKPPERVALKRRYSWFVGWLHLFDSKSRFTPESLVLNGTVSNQTESGIDVMVETDPKKPKVKFEVETKSLRLTADQTRALAYYADDDHTKNGPLPGISDDEVSKKIVREFATEAISMSNDVYTGFVIASVVARAVQQAVIGRARYLIWDKKIDLLLLLESTVAELWENRDVRSKYEFSRDNLEKVTSQLLGLGVGSFLINFVLLQTCKDVVDDFPKQSAAFQLGKVNSKLSAGSFGVTSVAGFAALGILTTAGLSSSTLVKQRALIFVPAGFAASDFAGGAADIVAVLREGKAKTPAGIARLIGATAKLTNAAIVVIDYGHKLYYWDLQNPFFKKIPAIGLTSIGATVAAVAYLVEVGLVAAGA